MAALKDVKTVAAPFSNAMEIVRVQYDFSQDGGAAGDYDALIADGELLVGLVAAHVDTAVTSATTLDLDLGKGAGGVDFLSSVAVANLTLDSVHVPSTANQLIRLADGEKIIMGFDVGAATAGVIDFIFKVLKV